MKRIFLMTLAALTVGATAWGAGINYNGTTLELNNDFTRSECGTMAKKTMKETSGLAASRQTPGYLWAHGDENTGDNRKIIAVKSDGTLAMTVNLTTTGSDRDDWEDICTGVYGGKNYVFVGAIGDNDLAFKDQYDIYYFEEPVISSGSISLTVPYIRFGYPDNKAHNTETLMYDNIEQMFYIADKVDGVCHLYKLPFRTDYGTSVQTLTEVCALGNGSTFKLANGGDITPDGQWIAIKNESYVLLWERQGSESLSETVKRLPEQVSAYEKEEQGESLAWLDATTFYTTSDSKKNTPIYQYKRAADPTIAIVTGISINGTALAGFQQDQTNYDVILPYGTTSMPTITATASTGATITVNLPIALPGDATVTCTSKDGSNSVTYTIHLTISATPSTDATLKSLSVNGALLEGFKADSLNYTMTIAYLDALPVVTAEANEAHATVQISNVTEVTKTGSTATVVVTAQDGLTTKTYTITFKRADAIKKINEVIMSNSYSAFIREGETTIHAYYLAGEAEPTVKSYKLSEGCTWTQEGTTVTITGADETTATYTLDIQSVQPREFTADLLTLDGTETWIVGAYGFDSNKKWRISKTDTDYSREIAGKTHLEFFLPACDTIEITSSISGSDRALRVYANGTQIGDKVTLLKNGTLTFAVNQSAPFMFTIASAQSSGDAGIKAFRMARKPQEGTAVEQIQEDSVRCTKVLRNGQILILKGDQIFTITGQPVR